MTYTNGNGNGNGHAPKPKNVLGGPLEMIERLQLVGP